MPNLIALAIPFFFLLMGVELWAASRRRVKLYRFADVIADLSCGMTQQIFLVFSVAVITGGDAGVFQHPPLLFPAGRISPPGGAVFAADLPHSFLHPPSPPGNHLSAGHARHPPT